MSFINDALNKVQKEKESPYAAYGDVLSSAGGKPSGRKKKPLRLAGLMIALLFIAAGAAVFFYRGGILEESRITSSAPVLPAMPLDDPPPPVYAADSRAAGSGEGPDLQAADAVRPQTEAPPAAQAEPQQPPAAHPESAPPKALPDTETLFAQALEKQRTGNLEDAKELYKQVIRQDQRHLQALNNLGVVYMEMKRYKWAVIRLNDALRLKPDYADAHYNLACLYARKNDTERSLLYLKNAVGHNPAVGLWAVRDDDFTNLARLPAFKKIVQIRDN